MGMLSILSAGNPLIVGVLQLTTRYWLPLIFIVGGISLYAYGYFSGKSGANERFEKAKTEAILKDTKENIQLSKEAMQIVEKAKDETEKNEKTVEAQIKAIKNLGPNKYLDVKLSDIGLQ